jgi:AraC-like DNA-binding protein
MAAPHVRFSFFGTSILGSPPLAQLPARVQGEDYRLAASPNSAARDLKSRIDQENGNVALRLAELSRKLRVSEREMRRAFKRLFQVTPREYQCRVRMNYAMTILRGDTGASIDELALQLGYSDRADFTKCFKKYVGVAPGEYRCFAGRVHGAES